MPSENTRKIRVLLLFMKYSYFSKCKHSVVRSFDMLMHFWVKKEDYIELDPNLLQSFNRFSSGFLFNSGLKCSDFTAVYF